MSCDLGRYAETIYLSALELAMFFVFVFVESVQKSGSLLQLQAPKFSEY